VSGETNYLVFGLGLLAAGHDKAVTAGDFTYRFENGQRAFFDAVGVNYRRLGREKDHEQFMLMCMIGLANFT